MVTTVKNILIEALSRSNLVPRKRVAPADMLQDAFRLFKGLVSKYNFANFISYSRDSIELFDFEEKAILEELNVGSIATVNYKEGNEFNDLRFVAFEQFHSEPDDYVYTWKYNTEGKIEIYFKKEFVKSHSVVNVIVNKELSYDLNDELKVPEIYVELFTSALTYKLALTYPRMDASQVTMLKQELTELEGQVKALVSSNKILTRNVGNISDRAAFMSGSFLFGR